MLPIEENYFSVSCIGGDGSQMRILTKPQTFQKPIGGNITFPCSVLNLGNKKVFIFNFSIKYAMIYKTLQHLNVTLNIH